MEVVEVVSGAVEMAMGDDGNGDPLEQPAEGGDMVSSRV